LLERHHRGDAASLLEIVQRDIDWVRTFVHRSLGGVVRRLEDTADVVQEVMLTVLSDSQHFVVADKKDFRALIATIVLNHLRSRGRYHQAAKRDAGRERAGQSDSVLYLGSDMPAKCVVRPDQNAEQHEALALVRLARELIDPESREVLEMREAELAFSVIGEMLGCTEEAARKRYGTAVRQLQASVRMLEQGRLRELTYDCWEPGPRALEP
jgi:RNA polymerase sigma factor (sigma-70 family)